MTEEIIKRKVSVNLNKNKNLFKFKLKDLFQLFKLT